MKIIILTEGSKEIGFGHITRCVSLYDAFQKNGITPQFVINGDQSVQPLLNRKNYRILDWIVEKEIFYSLIENADCVIVDSYLISNNLCNLISDIVKTPVFIDFIQKRKYKRGIVIDGSITQSKFIYGHEICYLKGIEYVMLREEFNEIPQRVIRKNIQSILITLGGTDIRNLMPLIQTVFSNVSIKKKLVIGSGFVNIEEISSKVDTNTELIFQPDAEGMKRLMLEADMAITSGGQTLFELARIGVPSIIVGIANNQNNNINFFKRKQFSFAGWWSDTDLKKNLLLQFKEFENFELRTNISRNIKEIVDGKGVNKVVKKIINYELS